MKWALLLLAGAGAAFGQTYRLPGGSDGVHDLSKATWRFHAGDNAEWARPDLDDSKWSLLAGDKSWDAQGYRRYSGFAWYRLQLSSSPGRTLKIALTGVSDAYELFADGVMIGRFGELSSEASPLVPRGASEPTAAFTTRSANTEIAIRVWHWDRWAVYHEGGFGGRGILTGSPESIDEVVKLRRIAFVVRNSANMFLGLLGVLCGIFSLILFWKERSAAEYLWFGVFLIAGSADMFSAVAGGFLNVTIDTFDAASLSLGPIANLAMILFIGKFVNRPPGKPATAFLFAQIPVLFLNFLFAYRHILTIAAWNLFIWVNGTCFWAILLYLIYSRIRVSRSARTLALPISFLSVSALVQGIVWSLYTAGLTKWTPPNILNDPVFITWDWLMYLLFLGAMAWILIERFAESRSEQTRMRGEFEAAQQVQNLLLQSRQPDTGELPVKVTYVPAAEVGGDFFRVFRRPDGAALVLVGDVSGKGLKAAMLVAGIIGALESMVTETATPAEILSRLNGFLIAKSGEGFVTCICSQIEPDGRTVISSAGHLPPYLDGEELAVAGSLPLGLSADAEFSEQTFRLGHGSRLAFVTDGVVEAMSDSGELFGFERTRQISAEEPDVIAARARAFGQNDDITVLQIMRPAATRG